MATIFVLFKCELGRAYQVAAELVDRVEETHVSEVHSISGAHDLIAKFYLPADIDVGHFVTERIQTIPGVRDTFTLMALKAF
ncbi:MAG TPA: Lrp/AsnC ligand binding domain-containing protein [Alphaproteobacteria bacterium]|nr:Lrp/AsnC ligand binding domain-containing protein [Alphaproteobacteria bacterium]